MRSSSILFRRARHAAACNMRTGVRPSGVPVRSNFSTNQVQRKRQHNPQTSELYVITTNSPNYKSPRTVHITLAITPPHPPPPPPSSASSLASTPRLLHHWHPPPSSSAASNRPAGGSGALAQRPPRCSPSAHAYRAAMDPLSGLLAAGSNTAVIRLTSSEGIFANSAAHFSIGINISRPPSRQCSGSTIGGTSPRRAPHRQ